jgi:ankyrin repeat protein
MFKNFFFSLTIFGVTHIFASQQQARQPQEIQNKELYRYFEKSLHRVPKSSSILLSGYLSQGGHVDDTIGDWSLLMRFAAVGRVEVVRQLIKAGANPRFRARTSLMTPYIAAKTSGHDKAARIIKRAVNKKLSGGAVSKPLNSPKPQE